MLHSELHTQPGSGKDVVLEKAPTVPPIFYRDSQDLGTSKAEPCNCAEDVSLQFSAISAWKGMNPESSPYMCKVYLSSKTSCKLLKAL